MWWLCGCGGCVDVMAFKMWWFCGCGDCVDVVIVRIWGL